MMHAEIQQQAMKPDHLERMRNVHYCIAGMFGGGSLVNLVNRPWFAKLKPTKSVVYFGWSNNLPNFFSPNARKE